jgi:hypothetical protein
VVVTPVIELFEELVEGEGCVPIVLFLVTDEADEGLVGAAAVQADAGELLAGVFWAW